MEEKRKKYKVNYTSGATSYGWDESCDTIKQVIRLIKDLKNEYTAEVLVYDYELGEFIFWKDSLTYKFYKDYIFTNKKRDLRTKNRLKK